MVSFGLIHLKWIKQYLMNCNNDRFPALFSTAFACFKYLENCLENAHEFFKFTIGDLTFLGKVGISHFGKKNYPKLPSKTDGKH